MDYIVHGVTKCQTRLSDFHFHFQHYSIPNKVTFLSWNDLGRSFILPQNVFIALGTKVSGISLTHKS